MTQTYKIYSHVDFMMLLTPFLFTTLNFLKNTSMIFVYIFAALIIALLIITALMPKDYHVEKNIVIKNL